MTSKRVKSSNEMVVSRNKNKILCSTPEHRNDSPSRDSDSLCDSDSASPVPFLCTQDGTEGKTDVIWNHYTPKSGTHRAHIKNTTPLSSRSKKSLRPKVLEKPIPKRRAIRTSQKKNALFQELLELNQNLHEIIGNKAEKNSIPEREDSDDDIFKDVQEFSPKSGLRINTCLRKNLLSSKFTKPEPETGLDSDDSMNECLLKATQVVEENILKNDVLKRPKSDVSNNKTKCPNSSLNFKMDQDSMDAILNSIKLDSPCAKRVKKCNSPQLVNDSFDGFVGNLNDSALERLTQMPSKTKAPVSESKTEKPNELHLDFSGSFSRSTFSRYSSMPESPSIAQINKPSTSGMVFGRYSSMPMDKNNQMDPGDSPIRCTPDEIKKKHQLAREKLLAKRQLPFTSLMSSNALPSIPEQSTTLDKCKFKPKIPSDKAFIHSKGIPRYDNPSESNQRNNTKTDIKSIIEKKRQEALMKLRLRKQTQTKT